MTETAALDQQPKAPASPPPPKLGWWEKFKKDRADKAHAKWLAKFVEEFAKPESVVHQTVLVQANAMARGMVMRHFDDRGIPRCRLCLSTDQLVKRVLERKRGPGRRIQEKAIMLCQQHKDVQLPAPAPKPAPSPLTKPWKEMTEKERTKAIVKANSEIRQGLGTGAGGDPLETVGGAANGESKG